MFRKCSLGLLLLATIGLAGCPCTSDWTRQPVQGLETSIPANVGERYAPNAGNGVFPARAILMNAATPPESPRQPVVFHNELMYWQENVNGQLVAYNRPEFGCDYFNSVAGYQYSTLLYDDPQDGGQLPRIGSISSIAAAMCGDVIYVPYMSYKQVIDEDLDEECSVSYFTGLAVVYLTTLKVLFIFFF